MTKRLSPLELSGVIALIGLSLWGGVQALEVLGIRLSAPEWLGGLEPTAVSLWWLIAWALIPRLGARLLDDLQLSPSEYRGVIAMGLMALVTCLTTGSSPTSLLIGTCSSTMGLVALLLSQGERHAPTRYLLLGVIIGLGALWEPWALALVPLVVLSMALLGSLTPRHITATLMGVATTPLVAMPIVAYYLADLSALVKLTDDWLALWQIDIGGNGYLSIGYILIIALGIVSLSTATLGYYHEGVRERHQSATLVLWVAGLLALSLLTGGSRSIFTTLVLFPLSLSVARTLDHLSGRTHTIALSVVGTLLALSILISTIIIH